MAEAKRAALGLETDDPSVFRFARQQYASSVERERIISGTLFLLVSSVVLTYVVLTVGKQKRKGLFDFGRGRGGFDVVPVVILAFPLFSLGVYAAIGWKGKVSMSGYLLLLSVLVFGAVALTDALLNREDKTLPVIYGVGFGVLVVAAYVLWWRGQARALVERNREFDQDQRLAEGPSSPEKDVVEKVEEEGEKVVQSLADVAPKTGPLSEKHSRIMEQLEILKTSKDERKLREAFDVLESEVNTLEVPDTSSLSEKEAEGKEAEVKELRREVREARDALYRRGGGRGFYFPSLNLRLKDHERYFRYRAEELKEKRNFPRGFGPYLKRLEARAKKHAEEAEAKEKTRESRRWSVGRESVGGE